MAFSEGQVQTLSGKLSAKHVRTRQANGRTLSYIEGWHVIAEANRIFGFDAWARQTMAIKCVWEGTWQGKYRCAYVARVRIKVRAGEGEICREGCGSGQGRGNSPGEAHESALKEAETDAMKRALTTFGNPFGLALYDKGALEVSAAANETDRPVSQVNGGQVQREAAQPANAAASSIGQHHAAAVGPIDKSALPISAPRRIRDKDHLRYVASQPCLVCGRSPGHAHHIRYAQPRAMGRKVSDAWTVPLCATHHRALHTVGDEERWWKERQVDPIIHAEQLWQGRWSETVQITSRTRELMIPGSN